MSEQDCENEVEWIRKAEIIEAEFLAIREAHEAVLKCRQESESSAH